MPCPFCDLDHQKTRILKDGAQVRVIFSNPRLMPGHLLVVPKRHVEKISELNKEERQEFFQTVIKYQEKILSKLATGCDIRQHYRPFQTQSKLKIDHLHIHLLPREFNDELYEKCQVYEKGIFKELSEGELNKLTNSLS